MLDLKFVRSHLDLVTGMLKDRGYDLDLSLFNSLVTCMFGGATQFLMVGFGPTMYSEILNKITGWDTTPEELIQAGERIFNLQRLFNYRLKGWDYKNDSWADKGAYAPGKGGIYKGELVPWNDTLREYYSEYSSKNRIEKKWFSGLNDAKKSA